MFATYEAGAKHVTGPPARGQTRNLFFPGLDGLSDLALEVPVATTVRAVLTSGTLTASRNW